MYCFGQFCDPAIRLGRAEQVRLIAIGLVRDIESTQSNRALVDDVFQGLVQVLVCHLEGRREGIGRVPAGI